MALFPSKNVSAMDSARAALQNPEQQKSYQELISRILFLLGALAVFRFGAHIPIAGINPERIAQIFQENKDTILSMFNMFSGGALERMSIFALGIMPYISASIIVQLMSAVVPSMEALKKEGDSGRRKLSQMTRQLTLALALIQALGLSSGLLSQGLTITTGLNFYIPAITGLVAGSMFLMWLGEQITERGIGNGISMIIFAGIVAVLPSVVAQAITDIRQDSAAILTLLFMGVLSIVIIAAVVFMETSQRRIKIFQSQRQQQGRQVVAMQHSFLPLKINMAGVIPAIFASSLLLFPASISAWLAKTPEPNAVQRVLQDVALVLSPGQPLYLLVFAVFIIFFCFFYTALMFNPTEVAENLKRSNAVISGIRPGEQTSKFLDKIINRLTLIGSIYMAIICLMPMVLQQVFSLKFSMGGTSILIVVVVVIDFMAQLQAHMTSQQYGNKSLLGKPRN